MKGLFLVAVAVAVLVAGGVATGYVRYSFFWGDPDEPPAAVREVYSLAAAVERTGAVETSSAVNELFNLAKTQQRKAAVPLLRDHLPPLAQTLAAELPVVQKELEAVEVETSVGVSCRRAVLRLVAHQEWMYRDLLAAETTTHGELTTKALERFIRLHDTIFDEYAADVERCMALARPAERPIVADLML